MNIGTRDGLTLADSVLVLTAMRRIRIWPTTADLSSGVILGRAVGAM